MRLMPVKVPEEPRKRIEATPARLARNIAPLFGVDWAENPRACTWLCDYETLTLAEIGRGGPLPTREWHAAWSGSSSTGRKPALGQTAHLPAGTWWLIHRAMIEGVGPQDAAPPDTEEAAEAFAGMAPIATPQEIAPATLNRFGPDRKAAALLVGANALFAPLLDVVSDVVGTIGTLDSGRLVAPVIRVAIWAHLVQQCYRSEPVLFAAAVQARAIQRALVNDVPVDLLTDLPTARCELGDSNVATWGDVDSDLKPRELNILDETFRTLRLDFLGDMMGESGHRYLAEDLVDRWTKYLLHSTDRGLLWAQELTPGHRRAEVFAPVIGLANGLVDELAGVLPLSSVRDPRFGYTEEEALEETWHLLVPRQPSIGELSRFDKTTQRAIVWSLLQVYRLLRENHRYTSREMEIAVAEEASRLAVVTRQVLGPADPITHVVAARDAAITVMEQRGANFEAALEGVHGILAALDDLRALHQDGLTPSGSLAEQIWALSAAVHVCAGDLLQAGRTEEAMALYARMTTQWETFFQAVGLRLDDVGESIDSATERTRVQELSPHLHNYAALLMMQPDPASQDRGMAIQETYVLPARRRILAERRSDGPLRAALQVLVRAMSRKVQRLMGEGDRERAARVALAARPFVDELSSLPQMLVRISPGYECTSHRGASALVSLVDAWLTLSEQGVASPHVDMVAADRALDALMPYLEQDHQHETTFSTFVLYEQETSLARLRERLDALTATPSA